MAKVEGYNHLKSLDRRLSVTCNVNGRGSAVSLHGFLRYLIHDRQLMRYAEHRWMNPSAPSEAEIFEVYYRNGEFENP